MNSTSAVKFIRKGGHVIPIGPAYGAKKTLRAGVTVGANAATSKNKGKTIKPRKALRAAGFGLSIASGILAAATFASGTKGVIGGTLGSLGLDAASTSANIAAYAGKGHGKARAKAALKQEAINQSVGWGIYAAGLIGMKRNRTLIKAGAKAFGLKALNLIRRV